MRIVLASASPARLRLLRDAGLAPDVIVGNVDEDAVLQALPAKTGVAERCEILARAKAHDVGVGLAGSAVFVVGADSLLDVDGVAHGKPRSVAVARERWATISGRSAVLHTGQAVLDVASGRCVSRVSSTEVCFTTPTPAELEAYLQRGEPLAVAGGFTLDGLGAAFVSSVSGSPSGVIGLSLPDLRLMVAELGLRWTDLWGDAHELRRQPSGGVRR